MNDRRGAARRGDLLDIGRFGEGAFEDDAVGGGGQQVLDLAEGAAGERTGSIVQYATMRGIERDAGAGADPGEPGIEAALGAVAVQHIDAQVVGEAANLQGGEDIVGAEHARDGQRVDAERRERTQAV